MKKSFSLIATTLALSLVALSCAVGCGGSDDKAAGSCDSGNAFSGTMGSDECVSCVKDACSSQYSSFCTCGANASSAACQSAVSDIGTCAETHCSTQCDTGDDGSGAGASSSGGAGNSSGASNSSGGAGTPTTANCVALEACCGTLPGDSVQGPCFQSAGFNNDGPCLNLLKAYQNAGQCTPGSATESVACTVDDTCTKQSLPGTSAEGYKMGCTASGGTVSDECSSQGVLGCCTISISEVCSYKDGGLSQDDCTQAGGTYSATP